MKKLLPKVCLSLFLTGGLLFTFSFRASELQNTDARFFAKHSSSAIVASPYKEFILQVNELNEKNLDQVRTAIESGGGMMYKGYCPKLKVVMYLINREEHPDNSFLDKLTTLSFTYQIKEGTIAQVCAECGMTPEGGTNQETE
ncbi:MAG TPA: hypothetical protein VK826_00980 [Bacteroidia bacterium]|nr:hypothetical protein [Bacteroidia bacterium]